MGRARLENWRVFNGMLVGDIYDDEKKRFEDGTPIISSPVQEINFEKKCAWTKHTFYVLGEAYVDDRSLVAKAISE